MSLAVALEEIRAGPSGPRQAAIFDFDGTLLDGLSVRAFLAERLRRREVDGATLARTAGMLAESLAGAIDDVELVRRGFAEWRGRAVADLERLGETLYARELAPRLRTELRALVAAHRRRGHVLVIASSAAPFQVLPAARALGIEHVLCTRLASVDGVLTGAAEGPVLWGPHKAAAVQVFAAARRIELARSWFYADGDEDEALMHLVGGPRPVNPRPRLARVAARRGWPVLACAPTGTPPDAIARGLVASASVVPVALAALGLRWLTGDARAAANLFAGTLTDLAFALGKVRLEAVGEHNLWRRRPAVFVWNHRNVFDAQAIGRLVRRDFGAVAKRELARVPLFALASRFLPIAFIDREDRRAAIAALEPVVRLLREGCSVVIAPEGTRVAGDGLAPFKKGAFRVAMAAGVPIVPVVFRNADALGPRDAAFMRPGTLQVAVLPPIAVDDWTLDDLDARVAEVRARFERVLAHWPADGDAVLDAAAQAAGLDAAAPAADSPGPAAGLDASAHAAAVPPAGVPARVAPRRRAQPSRRRTPGRRTRATLEP